MFKSSKEKDNDRITCKEAAEMLGCTPTLVQRGLITKTLPIGAAIPPSDEDKRWTYLCYRSAVERLIEGSSESYKHPDWVYHMAKFVDRYMAQNPEYVKY